MARRWPRNWYPGLDNSTMTATVRGIPAVVAPSAPSLVSSPLVPGYPLQASNVQYPSAEAYPVRDVYIIGEPLPPATNVLGGSPRR